MHTIIHTINLNTEFELPSYIRFKDMTGVQKFNKKLHHRRGTAPRAVT